MPGGHRVLGSIIFIYFIFTNFLHTLIFLSDIQGLEVPPVGICGEFLFNINSTCMDASLLQFVPPRSHHHPQSLEVEYDGPPGGGPYCGSLNGWKVQFWNHKHSCSLGTDVSCWMWKEEATFWCELSPFFAAAWLWQPVRHRLHRMLLLHLKLFRMQFCFVLGLPSFSCLCATFWGWSWCCLDIQVFVGQNLVLSRGPVLGVVC